MADKTNIEIYFHVGMGKVASKYLQFKVFPKITGIRYIPTGKYRKSKDIIRKGQTDKYLVSREFDRQMEDEAQWFSRDYPQAKTIILLRRHDSWIASQYRRFVKNGFPGKFTEFMDIENNTGKWDRKELLFYGKIKILEKYFQHKPLVLFYDDFREDPKKFLLRLMQYMGANIDFTKISFSPKHSSYNEKQLKVMQYLSRKITLLQNKESEKRWYKKLRRWVKMPLRYPVLYLAKYLPEAWVTKEALISKVELEKIREAYSRDWQQCQEYAQSHNPVIQ